MRQQWRQGDVLFAGEATGDAHRVASADGRARTVPLDGERLLLEVGRAGATILRRRCGVLD